MKGRALALLSAVCLVLGLVTTTARAAGTPEFDDVSGEDWFYESVAYVTRRGLMAGTGGTSFSPDTICDRAMFVTVLHRMEGTPQAGEVAFLDVPGDAYYAAAVAWARTVQLVKGYGDGRFGPNDPLTREQMLVLLHRYAQHKGLDVSAVGALDGFSDAGETAAYARDAVAWGVGSGLLLGTGEGRLEPAGVVTRAQAAAFLARFGTLSQSQESAQRFALREFEASQTALAAGTGAKVTFTVRSNRRLEEIALCRDGGVVLGVMNDDGRDGDAQAGDWVYTCVWDTGDLPAGTYSCYAEAENVQSRAVEVSLSAGGVITGRVCKAEGRAAVPGAVMNVYQDGLLRASVTSSDVGAYSLYLPAGNYHIAISCPGYLPFNAYAAVTGGSETYNETYLLVEDGPETAGSASGMVVSSITGKGMEEISLTVRAGWNNTSVGDVLASAVTGADGRYALELPPGNYTALATKEGCIPVAINIVSTASGAKNQNGSITPIASGNLYRVVLTWDERPSDMDSHMVGQDSEGRAFHVSFGTGGVPGPSGTYICNLDVDDTNSYGPETITLDPQPERTYYYYVQQYSDDGAMSASAASVRVYRGDTLTALFNVPTNQGNGMVWNVFAVKDGEIVLRHTVTNKPDLTYAD